MEKIEDWLDPTGVYRLVQPHTRRLVMNTPIPLDVGLAQLTEI